MTIRHPHVVLGSQAIKGLCRLLLIPCLFALAMSLALAGAKTPPAASSKAPTAAKTQPPPPPIHYTPGTLDIGFGQGGKTKTEFYDESGANAVAAQGDGKIVVGGFTFDGEKTISFALARYNPDGRRDSSFGEHGTVITTFRSSISKIQALAIQSDGKILAAGSSGNGMDDFALARYNTNGSLDTSFGQKGIVITDFGPYRDRAHALVLQKDGKIIAGGFCNGASDLLWADFALARYNPDCSLDHSFGSEGKVITPAGAFIDEIHGLALYKDHIIAVGYTGAESRGSADFAVLRYNMDGSLDASFGEEGRVITDLGGADGAHAVSVQNDGKILVAGYSETDEDRDFALVRYNTDGSPDAGFGKTGIAFTDFMGKTDEAQGMVIQSDGKIVLAGRSFEDETFRFALARYLPDGHLDTTLGLNGKIKTEFGYSSVEAQAIALQADGQWVVVGSASEVDAGNFFALARYHP